MLARVSAVLVDYEMLHFEFLCAPQGPRGMCFGIAMRFADATEEAPGKDTHVAILLDEASRQQWINGQVDMLALMLASDQAARYGMSDAFSRCGSGAPLCLQPWDGPFLDRHLPEAGLLRFVNH